MTRLLDITRSIDGLWNLANLLLDSRLLPQGIDKPEKVVAIILKGDELGIAPMHALEGITVIQGKPTVSPQLMLSLIERSGLLEDMTVEESPHSCSITMKRRSRSPQTIAFTKEEAAAMGLWGKGNWSKMPGVMLYWRCVAKACRRVFPDVIAGCYTPEEMGADVTEDGEVLEASVVERYQPEEPTPAPSPTGRGSGLGTKEHLEKTAKFNEWASRQCESINAKWHLEWEARLDRALQDGHGVPSKIPDVINPWGFKGHLVKWAVESERLDPSIVPEDVKTRQNDALCALVFYRSPDDKAALIAEMGRYLQDQRLRKSEPIYRKHPELAPDGYFEEQAEAHAEPEHGDAYEGPDDAAAVANGQTEVG
jgi:hypothetical protein